MGIHLGSKQQSGVRRGGWFQNPSELAADHDPAQLLGHFVVGSRLSVAPCSWPERELSGWVLRSESSLPVIDLVDSAGAPVGWLLGHPIDVAARTVVTGAARVPARREAADFGARFQAWLYGHNGRFAAVVIEPRGRAYGDALGSLPLFFEPGGRQLASSPFLLVDPGQAIPDSPLIDVIDAYGTDRHFPFATTCHRDASRLLPSHELDLDTFVQRRVWPLGPLPPVAPADAIEIVGSILEASMAAMANAGAVSMGLTAGGDCRMLLACARGFAEQLNLFTVPHADIVAAADVSMATKIASELGLDHRLLPWIASSDEEVRLWFYRTGAVAGESRGRTAVPTYHQLADRGKRACVVSVGVEASRGRAWNRGLRRGEAPDSATKRLSAAQIMARMEAPEHPAIVEAATEWLAGVPGLDALDTIDLCFLESTDGGWAGPTTFGYPETFTTTIFPFASRAILEAVLGLPHDYRGADRLRQDITTSRWPELDRFPVNAISRRARLEEKAHRIAHLPVGAVRRIQRRRLRRQFRPVPAPVHAGRLQPGRSPVRQPSPVALAPQREPARAMAAAARLREEKPLTPVG